MWYQKTEEGKGGRPRPRLSPQGADPRSLPLREEITPPPPHWNRRGIQPNHIKFFGHAALLRRCELPL